MIRDYKHYKARPKINKDRIASFLLRTALVAFCIYELIAIYGWMQQRDAQPDQLSVITYDCAPAEIEMNMPIEVRP